ncbi:MAG: YraN family protein [Bacteroidales bacterium]
MYEELTGYEIGRLGERLAEDYLKSLGMVLLERNYRSRHREIDLIMETEKAVHIVEVRSLRAPVAQEPQNSVNKKKQLFLIKCASSFVYSRKICKEVVFDIVAIIFFQERYKLEFFPEAFLPVMK